MLTARRLAPFAGLVALLALAGCDIAIDIFHEDPTKLGDDRSEDAKQLDDRIRGDILSAFVEQEVGTLKNVTVEVFEQNVLLTGTAAGPEAKDVAGSIASGAADVEIVFNEIQVMKDSSLRDKAEDLSVENRVKASLRESGSINSFNLRWHSVNGIVYIFGRAGNEAEREKALQILRSVSGVKDVVDHIVVRAPEGAQSWLDNLI